MKTCLLNLLVLFNVIVNAQTSVYHPFPDSNAYWNSNFQWLCMTGGGSQNDYYSTIISGDTIINAISYHKLYTPYWQHSPPPGCGYEHTGYRGAFRQDINAKKVFFIPFNDTTKMLIYDFNLQIGDTLAGYFASICSAWPPYIVHSIDSILIGSSYHKRWFLTSGTMGIIDMHIIEGIGSTEDPFSEPCVSQAFDAGEFKTICFQQDGVTLYTNTGPGNCVLINKIDEIAYFPVRIFYSTNYATISIKELTPDTRALELYDVNGKLVQSKEFEGNELKIDFLQLRAGIYYFRLKSHYLYSGKLIVY